MPKISRVGNMKVRTPKGGMSPRHRTALSKLMSGRKKLRTDKACTIIFYPGGVAAQRCTDRKLRATNRQQCRRGGTNKKTKYLFAPCGPGKRRGRKKR